ncbi:hypothetical protein CMI44_00915 [Candidatus Pacearchaeota archaeon]|nr:hypothetical protein [Candidatus Pacearchaeota archaeon]|tara:strand:+ start:420 stop:1070 length:651 start_codon:yes stop_codon:yes gene_type:complete
MLEKTSSDFRAFFIMQFTKELIRNSRPREFIVKKNLKPDVHEKPSLPVKRSQQMPRLKEISKANLLKPLRFPKFKKQVPRDSRRSYIFEPQLPPNLQYLKPTPTNLDLDLGKLNPLIRDPVVKIIECNGEDKNLIVKGTMGSKPTNIVLNREEIDSVIEKFSVTTKIPVHEGVFKVVAGRLILTAIISEVISPKFVIKKMTLPIGRISRPVPKNEG